MLPPEEDLLLSPELSPRPLVVEGQMMLAAWPVLGKPILCRAFQAELLTFCSSLGEATHIQHTTQPGLSGIAGVMEDKSIPFLQLWEI